MQLKLRKFTSLFILTFVCSYIAHAQDELNLLDDSSTLEIPVEVVNNAFKTTTVINLQSPMMVEAGEWDFKINHRFGTLNSGAYNAFGIDAANVRIGGEFGIAKNINIGIARSGVNKTFDGSLKVNLLKQKTDMSMPISLLYYGNVAFVNRIKRDGGVTASGKSIGFVQSLAYVNQLIIASKLSEAFTVQLSPSVVHYNLASPAADNTLYALGLGARAKITNRTTINAEWIPTMGNKGTAKNNLSLGVDLETGGHIFQLHLTNSQGMAPQQFIGQTQGDWLNGGVHFGFNISRVFKLYNTDKQEQTNW